VIDNVTLTGLNTRGWATLNAARTTFIADNGQLLRSPFTSTEGGAATPESNIAAMKNLGFNAIHLYVEGADDNYPIKVATPGYEGRATRSFNTARISAFIALSSPVALVVDRGFGKFTRPAMRITQRTTRSRMSLREISRWM
jgi:hypothetical protein